MVDRTPNGKFGEGARRAGKCAKCAKWANSGGGSGLAILPGRGVPSFLNPAAQSAPGSHGTWEREA